MTILDLAELELLQDLESDKLELNNTKARLREHPHRAYYLDLIEMVKFKYELEATKFEEKPVVNTAVPESTGLPHQE